jgi:hypothetical protein
MTTMQQEPMTPEEIERIKRDLEEQKRRDEDARREKESEEGNGK